jgi:hypothetical protein
MLLLLDVCGLKCATNYILLFIFKSPSIGYIVLYVMHVTMSISMGLYPKLNLWTANKYIALHYTIVSCQHAASNHGAKVNSDWERK